MTKARSLGIRRRDDLTRDLTMGELHGGLPLAVVHRLRWRDRTGDLI